MRRTWRAFGWTVTSLALPNVAWAASSFQASAQQAGSYQAGSAQASSPQGFMQQAGFQQSPAQQAGAAQAPMAQAPFPQAPTVDASGNPTTFYYIGTFGPLSPQNAWIEEILPANPVKGTTTYARATVRNGRLILQTSSNSGAPYYVTLYTDAVTGTAVAGTILNARIKRLVGGVVTSTTAQVTVTTVTSDLNTNFIVANTTTYAKGYTNAWSQNYNADDHLRYRLTLKASTTSGGATQQFNLCGAASPSSNFQDVYPSTSWLPADPYNSNYGLLLPGQIDLATGDYSMSGGYVNSTTHTANNFSLFCDGGTGSKAVRYFGYQPWNKFGTFTDTATEAVPYGFKAWVSASRGMTADYCENGHGLTIAGTMVDLYDARGLVAPGSKGSSYMWAMDSTWVTSENYTGLDCTGNIDNSATRSPSLSFPASGCTYSAYGYRQTTGARGDISSMWIPRWSRLAAAATCQVTSGFPNPEGAVGTNATTTIEGTAQCGGPTSIAGGRGKPAMCNGCTNAMATLDPYCTDYTAGHWDATCVTETTSSALSATGRLACALAPNANQGLLVDQ